MTKHGGPLSGAQSRLDDQRDRGDAHAFRESARDEKCGSRGRLYFCAKPSFHQLVRRIIFSAEVVGQKHQDDHHASHQVSEHQLQEREVSRKGQRRSANNGERGCFGRDDGKRQGPPGRRAAAQEIIADCALAPAKCDTEQSYADQVDGNNGEVQRGQAHGAGVAIIGACPSGVKRASMPARARTGAGSIFTLNAPARPGCGPRNNEGAWAIR